MFKRTSLGMFTAAALLAACALQPPQPGAARVEVLRTWGAPTARYVLPEGAERLEYASGPYGRQTWMVDTDRQGRVVQTRQVLGEAEFLRVMSLPGLRSDTLLRELGRPGERRHGGMQGGEVWSWRYPTNDCLWYEVSVARDGAVTGGGYFVDPRCDTPSDYH